MYIPQLLLLFQGTLLLHACLLLFGPLGVVLPAQNLPVFAGHTLPAFVKFAVWCDVWKVQSILGPYRGHPTASFDMASPCRCLLC